MLNKTKHANRNQLGSISKIVGVVFAFFVISVLSSLGANYTWDGNAPGGGGGNARWSTANNWGAPDTADTAPPTGAGGLTTSDVFFAGSTKTSPQVDGSSYFIRTLTFNSGAASFTMTPMSGGTLRIGTGGIVNNSANIQNFTLSLILSNSQTWDAGAGGLSVSANVVLNAHTLNVAGSANTALNNPITGTGGLSKTGSGTLSLLGANTFSGGVVLNQGQITAGAANVLGSGSIAVNGGTLSIGTFNQTVGTVTVAGGTISGSTGILTGSGYQAESGSINARLGGIAPLVKSTSGTVTLSGVNTYSGGTTINGGSLFVNNTSGSGLGTGAVTVNSGGKLSGTGTYTGTTTVKAGASISSGATATTIGQLNIAQANFEPTATIIVPINDVDAGNGVGHGLLNSSAGLDFTLANSANKLNLDIVSLTLGGSLGLVHDFDSSLSYVWVIARSVSGIGFASGESEDTIFNLLTGNFVNSLDGGTFSLDTANSGRDLVLNFTPVAVPEPSTWALMILGAAGFAWMRRNRRS